MTNYQAPQEQQFQADLNRLFQRVGVLERQVGSFVSGAADVTSTSRPSNPATGMWIYETDTGLTAYWSGSAWAYQPQLVARQVLAASTASVTFSGIPQSFTHLLLEVCAKSDGTGGTSGYDNANLRFNGVTAGNYNWQTWYSTQGAGSVSTAGGTSQTSMQAAAIWNNHFGSAGRGISTIFVPYYSGTSSLKVFTAHSAASDGGSAGVMQLYAGSLGGSNTGAVTSLSLLMGSGNFVADSTFSLYGLG